MRRAGIGYQLLGQIRQQRTDTYSQAMPDRSTNIFYAYDLIHAVQGGTPRDVEDATKKLADHISEAFKDRTSYLRVSFLARDPIAKESREILPPGKGR